MPTVISSDKPVIQSTLAATDITNFLDADNKEFSVLQGQKLKFVLDAAARIIYKLDHSKGTRGATFPGTGGCPAWLTVADSGEHFITFEVTDGSDTYKGEKLSIVLNFISEDATECPHDPVLGNGGIGNINFN